MLRWEGGGTGPSIVSLLVYQVSVPRQKRIPRRIRSTVVWTLFSTVAAETAAEHNFHTTILVDSSSFIIYFIPFGMSCHIEELYGSWQIRQPCRDKLHHNEEREKWEIDKKKHHRKNKTDDKASGTPAGVPNDHNDDDIGIVIDDDQRKIERASATYSEQQKNYTSIRS